MEEVLELNPVLSRLTSFAETKGGPSKIYNAIGKQVSTYWNLVKNNSKPSVDTIIQIAEVFPDFDVNWVLLGKPSVDSSRISELESALSRERDIVTGLLKKSEGATNHPQVDREGASQLLTRSVRKNTRESNRVLLNNTWRFSTPN